MQQNNHPLAPADTRPLTILRPKRAACHVGVALSTLYRWTNDASMRFPQPVRLGANSSGWLQHELDAWLATRVAERDHALKVVA